MAELLKRTALAGFPRDRVASLTGGAWLAFLNETGGTDAFASYPGTALGDAQYQAAPGVAGPTAARLCDIAREWIRKHHTDRPC